MMRRFQRSHRSQHSIATLAGFAVALSVALTAARSPLGAATLGTGSPNFEIRSAKVEYLASLDLLIFEQVVAGKAGATAPEAKGSLDGAPVLGYVFPTTLPPNVVGFSATQGILALAVTSHPDFDDSPLWDENGDGKYDNDGKTWHTHWVVLGEDKRVAGGLAVKEFKPADGVVLPPTAPNMPMFMDSPGFGVVLDGSALRVLVPAPRVARYVDFKFDAVTAYMQVATSGDKPMLGVYEVYSVLSKNLSLPYSVDKKP